MFQITKLNDGSYSLNCSRTGECAADLVHACGIKYINEKDNLLEFVKCSLVEGFKNKTVPIEEVFKLYELILKIYINFRFLQNKIYIGFMIM